MYFLKIAGLGFIHKSWQDAEPRFCRQPTKAKSWTTLNGALDFGNQKLTPQIKLPWEVWQTVEGKLLPLIRPQGSR
ncbi:MAG: hypothetical protein F6K42_08755 [Leptolyngbya sp. SIO1D8]|nr:hypothetical protein [Leptolyngbya sp. SIO1D8]